MARVLSALVLLPVVIGAVWWGSAFATLVLAEIVLLLALAEYARLVAEMGARLQRVVVGTATAVTCAAMGWTGAVEVTLMAATIAIGLLAMVSPRRGPEALVDTAASLAAPLYLGLPLGAFVATRAVLGREAAMLLLVTIMVSDTAQYYVGRALGRRPLSPVISPKKTVEGALAGVLAAAATMPLLGRWWLPAAGAVDLALVGAILVAFGIAGDLFESLLKRSAGLKDASGLIPGHGGMLDRIDSLLFAAPVYYVYVRYSLP